MGVGATITVASDNETLTLETHESYSLEVTAPQVQISANTVFGAINGLETFSQLVYHGVQVNGTTIKDFPRYQFRASMIDTSRHYYPLEVSLYHAQGCVTTLGESVVPLGSSHNLIDRLGHVVPSGDPAAPGRYGLLQV